MGRVATVSHVRGRPSGNVVLSMAIAVIRRTIVAHFLVASRSSAPVTALDDSRLDVGFPIEDFFNTLYFPCIVDS